MAKPAPLTPPDCDLRAFRDMPLDVGRFRDSDLVTEEEPESIIAAILLWGVAWHQIPAASVPDNDRWLAKAAGFGRAVDAWLKVRDGALRGFIPCTDGRLYNRTLAEKALESWERRKRYLWQRAADRHRKAQRDLTEEEKTPFPEFETWKSGGMADYSAGTKRLLHRPNGQVPSDSALKGREGKGRKGSLIESHAIACVGSGTDLTDDPPLPPEPQSPDRPRPEHFFEIWNEVAERIGRPKVATLTGSRAQTLKARLAQFSPEDFQTAFAKVEASDFLAGRTTRWSGVTFDWLIKQGNFLKVLEGNYDQ